MIVVALLAGSSFAAEIRWAGGGEPVHPMWSPDGRALAFETRSRGGPGDVFVVPFATGKAGSPKPVAFSGVEGKLLGTAGYAARPSWLPSGMLVLEAAPTGDAPRAYLASAASPAANLLFPSVSFAGAQRDPVRAPNGTFYVFVGPGAGGGDLYTYHRVSGAVAPVVSTPERELTPSFSADGRHVVFGSRGAQGADIGVWSVGSTEYRPLIAGPGEQVSPRIIGDQVVYFTNERGQGWDLAVVPLEGGTPVVLAEQVKRVEGEVPCPLPGGEGVVYASAQRWKGSSVHVARFDLAPAESVFVGLENVAEPSVVRVGGTTWLAVTGTTERDPDRRQLHVFDVSGKF